MKISILLLCFLSCFLLCLSGCRKTSPLPPYVEEHADLKNESAIPVAYTCTYPIFTGEEYAPLNAVVQKEIEAWQDMLVEICRTAEVDVLSDPDMLTYERYLNVTYSLNGGSNNAILEVVFTIRWSARPNMAEPKILKTFSLYKNGNIFETITTTSRVYAYIR